MPRFRVAVRNLCWACFAPALSTGEIKIKKSQGKACSRVTELIPIKYLTVINRFDLISSSAPVHADSIIRKFQSKFLQFSKCQRSNQSAEDLLEENRLRTYRLFWAQKQFQGLVFIDKTLRSNPRARIIYCENFAWHLSSALCDSIHFYRRICVAKWIAEYLDALKGWRVIRILQLNKKFMAGKCPVSAIKDRLLRIPADSQTLLRQLFSHSDQSFRYFVRY